MGVFSPRTPRSLIPFIRPLIPLASINPHQHDLHLAQSSSARAGCFLANLRGCVRACLLACSTHACILLQARCLVPWTLAPSCK